MMSFRLSFYVLDHYHGESSVGIYSNGISITESIWLLAKSISLVQYARISNIQDRRESARLTARLIKFSLSASFVILIPIVFLPGSFYVFLFGDGFGDIQIVIRSLAVGVLVYNFSILLGHYFSGTGRYHINAITSSIGLAASIILYFTMIPNWGLPGAGWATSISYVITSLILLFIFSRENKGWQKELLPSKSDIKQIRSEFRL